MAYYAISSGAIDRKDAPGNLSRNAPNLIPIVVLGLLAVDESYKGQGLGAALLKDCVLRVTELSKQVGIKALLVHAIDEQACSFYKYFGFKESKFDNLVLLLPIK